jgi:two-component system, NarL family, sensor kinase
MGKFCNPRVGIMIFLITIFCLEVVLPHDYIVGYAYVVPILCANYKLKKWGKGVTIIAVGLTLLYVFDRQHQTIDSIPQVIFFNRILTSAALITAYLLSFQAQQHSELAATRQAELNVQGRLAELRTDFAAGLVHDLQTPLLGAIETINFHIQGDFGPVTAHQKQVLEIASRSHRMSIHQLQTILESCRNDSQGLYLNYQSSDLETIVANAIDTLEDFAKHRQIQIDWVNESKTTRLECDPNRIERVFNNLILNAIGQSPPHTSIVIRLQDESEHYRVQVVDRGRGIKAEDLTNIFVKHFQGDAIGRRAKGAGLGLYLARQIVESHGGTIWVESGVEKGATFCFTLPKRSSGERE